MGWAGCKAREGAEQIGTALFLHQPGDMQDIGRGRRGGRGSCGRQRLRIDPDVMQMGSGGGKAALKRLAHYVRGDAEETRATPGKLPGKQSVVDEIRRARGEQGRRRAATGDVKAVKGGNQRHAESPRKWQGVHGVRPEMGMDEGRADVPQGGTEDAGVAGGGVPQDRRACSAPPHLRRPARGLKRRRSERRAAEIDRAKTGQARRPARR